MARSKPRAAVRVFLSPGPSPVQHLFLSLYISLAPCMHGTPPAVALKKILASFSRLFHVFLGVKLHLFSFFRGHRTVGYRFFFFLSRADWGLQSDARTTSSGVPGSDHLPRDHLRDVRQLRHDFGTILTFYLALPFNKHTPCARRVT